MDNPNRRFQQRPTQTFASPIAEGSLSNLNNSNSEDVSSLFSQSKRHMKMECTTWLPLIAFFTSKLCGMTLVASFGFLLIQPEYQCLSTNPNYQSEIWYSCSSANVCLGTAGPAVLQAIRTTPESINNLFWILQLHCKSPVVYAGLLGSSFLFGHVLFQSSLVQLTEQIHRKYVLLITNSGFIVLYIVVMNATHLLQFVILFLALGILNSCIDWVGLLQIFETLDERLHGTVSKTVFLLRGFSLIIAASFFAFISKSTSDLLYYSLYGYLVSIVLLLVYPEDEGVASEEAKHEDGFQHDFNAVHETGRGRSQSAAGLNSYDQTLSENKLKVLQNRKLRFAKFKQLLKNSTNRVNILLLLVSTSVSLFIPTLLLFGLNVISGSIYYNAIALGLGDVVALVLYKGFQSSRHDSMEFQDYLPQLYLLAGIFSFPQIIFRRVDNEYLHAFGLCCLKIPLTLTLLVLHFDVGSLFDRRKFPAISAMCDNGARVFCVFAPVVAQMGNSSTLMAIVCFLSLLAGMLAFQIRD